MDIRAATKSTLSLLNEFDSVMASAPALKKEGLLRAFVHRIDIDRTQGKATCYLYRIPMDGKVYACRRSESNRHGIATGGF